MSPFSHMKYVLFGGAGLVVVALFFGAPLQTALFLGILLACPLMMFFMMGGHGVGHDHGHTGEEDAKTKQQDERGAQPHQM